MDNAPGGYFLPKKGVEFVTKEKIFQNDSRKLMVKYNYVRRRINSLIGMGILFFSQKRMRKRKRYQNLKNIFYPKK